MRFFRFLSLLACCSLFYTQSFAVSKKVTKIVLDAGHGGTDNGARGEYANEKDLTLAIVLKLGKLITDSLKGAEVVYTRTTDIYQKPGYKGQLANQSGADLLVCVHINSTPYWYEKVQTGTRKVTTGRGKKRRTHTVPVYKSIRHHTTKLQGVETLVLGSIRNNEKSQAVGEYAETVIDDPSLINESDPQSAIILAQYTKAFLGRSVELGTAIQEQFALQGRRDLGVKQQSLAILAGSYMPGVLVECGFITNPEEEAYMSSEAGQWEIARAIFRGIKAYNAQIAEQ